MLDRIREIAAAQLNVSESEIDETSSFKDDLGADSLDLFELVMALEDEFGIEIPMEDYEELYTVGDIVEYLHEKGVD